VTTTADLIEAMATNLRPVRRLRSPVVRAGSWLLLAAVVLALLAISQGLRADLSARLLDPAFVVGIAASLTTGACGFYFRCPLWRSGWQGSEASA